MKKSILTVIAFTLISSVACAQSKPTDDKKVPDAIMVRIQKVMLDQAALQNQVQQLSQQYNNLVQTNAHDAKELDQLDAEALKDAGLSDKEWKVDRVNGKFVPVPAAKVESKPVEKK